MINEFRGKYYFLSNFYPCKVEWQGIVYENNESAFQSAKCINLEQRKNFIGLDPSTAKRKGRRVKLRNDWEEIKDQVMYEIVLNKFLQNEDLKDKLLKTGEEELIEGNTWHDNHFGDCNCSRPKCKQKGKNILGKILMRVREELRNK